MEQKKKLLLLLLILTGGCRENISCADLYNADVIDISSVRDTDKVFRQLNNALKEEPACINGLMMRAILYSGKAEYEEAQNDYLTILQLDSSNIPANYALADLYNFNGNNDSAYLYITKALASAGRNGIITNYLSSNKNYNVTINDLFFLRGVIFFEKGLLVQSKVDMISSLKGREAIKEAYGYLAEIYSVQNKLDSACYYFKKAKLLGYAHMLDTSLIYKCN